MQWWSLSQECARDVVSTSKLSFLESLSHDAKNVWSSHLQTFPACARFQRLSAWRTKITSCSWGSSYPRILGICGAFHDSWASGVLSTFSSSIVINTTRTICHYDYSGNDTTTTTTTSSSSSSSSSPSSSSSSAAAAPSSTPSSSSSSSSSSPSS